MSRNGQHRPVFRIPSNADHERVSALFLGPKAENASILSQCFNIVVGKQTEARQAYFPSDPAFITTDLQQRNAYKDKVEELQDKLGCLLKKLGDWSLPFYSPRYSAHMTADPSLPAILGYLSTMFYNPNNVAFEASPFTTQIEQCVGEQLSEMMGYDRNKAWGHITCDGTVANLESIWVYRNLKFYPFSLRCAMEQEEGLNFIADSFKVELCDGSTKLLKDCSAWEMLNLPVAVVLDIPDRLYNEYSITSKFLEDALYSHLVQTIGKDVLMQKWDIKLQPTVVVPSTHHYSWPKSGALTGIGSDNVVNIDVDIDARMNIDKLREYLRACVETKRAVYEVVAVIGTTEEGAVDRLEDIIKLREEFRQYGLSFGIHADAAWGGYFATMLGPEKHQRGEPFVPHVGLRADTATHLRALKGTDSITVDPHKAGYIPYPAGGLCYKDGRMRYQVTWTAPYIDQGNLGESIGAYGVEGSKPGAAPAAVYLAHQVIGLNPNGYGVLLGEASFTCRRFASHWATMTDNETFFVIPMNRLPAEVEDPSNKIAIEEQKEFIREHIIKVSNEDLINDAEAMELLNKLGSDLNINAFACNFLYSNGEPNKDVVEANNLNRRIFERLSVLSPGKDPLSIPFYVTSTTFKMKDYGECCQKFKERLHLEGPQDLFVLRNVVMSPFSTTHGFLRELTSYFEAVVKDEAEKARKRNEEQSGTHTFIVQGTDKLYIVHLPTFYMASGRRQIILTASLSAEDQQKYTDAKTANPSAVVMMQNVDPMLLDDIVNAKDFQATISFPNQEITVTVSNVQIVKLRSLDTEDFDSSYPPLMPFYLYGTSAQPHIDHMLVLAPNIQLTAGSIQLTLNDGSSISDADLATGVIAFASDVHERAMQPFAIMSSSQVPETFFFKAGTQMAVKIYRDPFPTSTLDKIDLDEVTELLGEGSIRIVGDVYVDSERLNGDDASSSGMSPATKKEWVDAVGKLHERMSY
ncbi:hypothetical protein ACEPAG_9118 [Sanghuangporus baumii]